MFFAASVLSPNGGEGDIRFAVLIGMAAVCLILTIASAVRLRKEKRGKDRGSRIVSTALYLATGTAMLITLACCVGYLQDGSQSQQMTSPSTQPSTIPPTEPPATVTEPPVTEPPETVPPEQAKLEKFRPHKTESSDPANWGIKWEILVDNQVVENYTREDPIFFDKPESYYPFAGICTFRGNPLRNSPAYGTADINEGSISKLWSANTGSIGEWSGSGWTGQPLITRWDDRTKAIMNLYPEKKEKEGLVELIYATLDGNIYFLDADDGSRTRDPIQIGMCMKGAGALDPRGYPLMYVGTGDFLENKPPRMYIISLIDGSILYEGGYYDPNALRSWCAFDSSPLVCAATDTLIWPGENGILYTIPLNTHYDPAQGQLSVAPDKIVKARYSLTRATGNRYWIGMEDSCVIVGSYLFVADNAGMFFCVDLNTMELVWAQDTTDDNNATPVFAWGPDGNGYLYTAPSLHWTADANHHGTASVYKLNAQTGEIVWERPYDCDTIVGTSGGIQSSPAIGKEGTDLEGMVFFSVSYTPKYPKGILTALDNETGETRWELPMDSYSWCSPAAVYTPEGKGYLLMTSFYGTVYLVDGATGEVVATETTGACMEASLAIFENRFYVGTRGCTILGFELH